MLRRLWGYASSTVGGMLSTGTQTIAGLKDFVSAVAASSEVDVNAYTATASQGAVIGLQRSRGTTVGTNTIVQSGDLIGRVVYRGANGSSYDAAALVAAYVDDTPGASSDMPGRLSFWTTPNGSATPVERQRFTNAGYSIQLGAGTMPSTTTTTQTGSTILQEIYSSGSAAWAIHRESADANGPAMFMIKRRSGYATAINSGDTLGNFIWEGANGGASATGAGAKIRAVATGNWSTSSQPTKIVMSAVAASSTTLTDVLTVNPTGIDVTGSASQMTFGTAAGQGSVYSSASGVNFVWGATASGSTWTATQTTSNIIAVTPTGVQIFGNTGLTATNTFTPTSIATISMTGDAAFTGYVKPKSYTVATLPSASTAGAGATVYASDAGGNGPCNVTSNGTNWKRSDNASTTVS